MAAVVTTPQLEANYDKFIAELTKLTRKYGVALQSVGGVILADQPYFLGPEPTSVDASLYAFTGGIWLHPADNPLKQHMAALPNLVAYSERMHRRYFGERPPGRSEA